MDKMVEAAVGMVGAGRGSRIHTVTCWIATPFGGAKGKGEPKDRRVDATLLTRPASC